MSLEQNKENDVYDLCVSASCRKETEYKKSDHIASRFGYIEGAGQLCKKCFAEYNKLIDKLKTF